jgi:hypothetical protein
MVGAPEFDSLEAMDSSAWLKKIKTQINKKINKKIKLKKIK